MALQGRVKFIRKNGRVIPIRQPALTNKGKKDAKLAVEGAAITAAGVGTGVASGAAYRKAVSFSTKVSARAWNSLEKVGRINKKPARDLFQRSSRLRNTAKVNILTGKAFAASKGIGRLAPGLRIGGQAVATGLIGVGIAKMYRAKKKDANTAETASIAGVGASASFLTGSYGKSGLRKATKQIALATYPAIRKIKRRFNL